MAPPNCRNRLHFSPERERERERERWIEKIGRDSRSTVTHVEYDVDVVVDDDDRDDEISVIPSYFKGGFEAGVDRASSLELPNIYLWRSPFALLI